MPQSRKVINRVLCLPLLPSDKIVETFNQIKHENPVQSLTTWLNYVERQWITRRSAEELSVHGLRDRTNNFAESTFATFRLNLNSHPSVYIFLDFLMKRTKRDASDIERLRNSLTIKRPRLESTMLKERRIKNAQRLLSQDRITPVEMLDTLTGVASLEVEPEIPDSDTESIDSNHSDTDNFSLPEIGNDHNESEFSNSDGGASSNFSDLEDLIPDTFLSQSEDLIEKLNNCRPRYRAGNDDCVLMCGRKNGNLVLVPCGHNDYCLECMIQHCTINHTFQPRHVVKCPDDNCVIEGFACLFIR